MRALIDADVHCAPSLAALYPYLSDYWRNYIEGSAVRLPGTAYPPGLATSGPKAPERYEQLAEDLLDASGPETAILNCAALFEVHRHSYYAAALATAINDWLQTEWLDRDDRLRASIVVSPVDVDDAIAEVERVGEDPRFVQVLLPIRADAPYGNRRYHPLLAAAAERGLVIGLHAWGRTLSAPTPPGLTHTHFEDYLGNEIIVQSHILSLISEGVFERLPELRVAVLECGFAWLPPLLWRFDKDWKGVWPEVPWVRERPSSYLPRHFRFTTAPAHLPRDPSEAAELVAMVGAELLMYASDHPHRHGTSADVLDAILDEDQRNHLYHANATSFYALHDRVDTPDC